MIVDVMYWSFVLGKNWVLEFARKEQLALEKYRKQIRNFNFVYKFEER